MRIPRYARRLASAAAFAIAICSACPGLAAQENVAAPAAEISCSSNFGNPVELDKTFFRIAPVPPAEIAAVEKSKPSISAGPFEDGKFPYDKVEIYLHEKDIGEADTTGSTVSLYVRAVRNQKESWFILAHDPADRLSFDFLERTKGDTGPDSANDNDNDPGPTVSLAVKNKNVPIFEISWWRNETGASTAAAVQKILILDFRTLHPSVFSVLQCISAEGGGVCGDYDNGMAPTTTLVCNWDSSKSDFLCVSSVTGDFTPPVTHRHFLASGADAPYSAKAGDPPSLSGVASWGAYDAAKHYAPDIPGLGPVTVIGQYSSSGARDPVVLFASRGSTSFEPRYFAVVVNSLGPDAAFEILPQSLVDEPRPASPTEAPSSPDIQGNVIPASINAADKFADDAGPSFHVQPLESLPNVSLWQVTAKQGTMQEIVWLAAGFNPGTGRFVFSAVRIASEFGRYASCGRTRSVPFAAAIDRKKGTMGVILDVEPAHQYTQDGKREDLDDQGNPTTPCPVRVKLFWNTSAGFIREESNHACANSTHARNLSITQAGQITTKPDDTEEQ